MMEGVLEKSLSMNDLSAFFQQVKNQFSSYSLQNYPNEFDLLALNSQDANLFFLCLDGSIVDPNQSRLLKEISIMRNFLSDNPHIESLRFDHSKQMEYVVTVSFRELNRILDSDYDDDWFNGGTGEKYQRLIFKKLELTRMSIDRLWYRQAPHVFLQDEINGLAFLKTVNSRSVPIMLQDSLSHMDGSLRAIFHSINPFINEMFAEKVQLPFTWGELVHAKNKFQFLTEKYKNDTFSKKVNKYPLRYSYGLMKLKKILSEKEYKKLLSCIEQKKCQDLWPNDLFIMSKRSTMFLQSLLQNYVERFILKEPLSESDTVTFEDLVFMALRIKHKMTFHFQSVNGMERYHDKIVDEYNFKQSRKMKKIEITRHKKFIQLEKALALDNRFVRITTNKELYIEGATMHHCVYSYFEKVQKGQSIIYKYHHDNHRYTLEIKTKRNGTYFLAQCYGKHDMNPEEKEFSKIQEVIESIPGNKKSQLINRRKK